MMTLYSNFCWPPYVSLVTNIKSNSYYYVKLEMGLQPNQAARIVAYARHQVKLPLVVEIELSENKSRLTRLAQAAAAAGANIIMLTAGDFPSAKAVLADLNATVTLPLVVSCPIASSDERRQLESLGATKVLSSIASESTLVASN